MRILAKCSVICSIAECATVAPERDLSTERVVESVTKQFASTERVDETVTKPGDYRLMKTG